MRGRGISIGGAALFFAALVLQCGSGRGTIGAMIARQRTGELRVHEVAHNLAADKAGLRPGDQLLLIDGMDVRALSVEQVHKALAGSVGEPVRLTVIRGEKVLRVTLRRTPARSRLLTAPSKASP